MTYTGFFVRDYIGQLPDQAGSSGNWSSCPDIIFWNQQNPPMACPNPQVFTTTQGYGTDYGSTVYIGQGNPIPNYIYLRAWNTNAAATPTSPVTGRAWFFYTRSDLALYPRNWKSDVISVAGNTGVNYQDITATAVGACQPALPYVFSPVDPQGQHYCGISWIENQPSDPPENPVVEYGSMGDLNGLVKFILDHPNMGWRNTTSVRAAGPTWAYSTNVTGPTPAKPFIIGISCSNMPTDGSIQFSIPSPGPGIPTINMPKMQIPDPNWYNGINIKNWTAGLQSSVELSYYQGATVPPAGADITITMLVPRKTLSAELSDRIDREAPHLVHMLAAADEAEELGSARLGVPPVSVIQIGAQTYQW
jgi:hypothetical protein